MSPNSLITNIMTISSAASSSLGLPFKRKGRRKCNGDSKRRKCSGIFMYSGAAAQFSKVSLVFFLVVSGVVSLVEGQRGEISDHEQLLQRIEQLRLQQQRDPNYDPDYYNRLIAHYYQERGKKLKEKNMVLFLSERNVDKQFRS